MDFSRLSLGFPSFEQEERQMSRKFVLIGAGSHVFTRNLVRDILTFPAFADATIALVDINPEGLEYARRAVQHIIDAGHYPAKLICTTDRTEVLPGADGVLSMLMAQPLEVFRRDLEICEKYGVKINVGDTRNPAGIFRFLRTVPVMLDVLKDVQRYCPNAVFLNYTNPMAMLCRAMQEAAPEVLTTGLCHSVQHGIEKFSKILNIPVNEIEYTCAGINHLAYYLKLTHNGENLYPALRQRTMNDPAVYDEDIVRNEVFLALGYYVTESSGHFSEYSPWFRKRDDLLEKYCYRGTSWNTGRTNFTIEVREKRKADYYTDLEKFLNEPADLQRGNEYAASIFNALFGDGQLYSFNGNVRNYGLIDNLPAGACVEVPVLASRNGLQPIHVGPIPDELLPLMHLSSQIEEMAVRACFEGDRELIYKAICYDPLTSAVLDLREIRQLVDELFAFSEPWLPAGMRRKN